MKLIFGACDCCNAQNRVLNRGTTCGLEAVACSPCRGGSLADDVDDLEGEIEALRPAADTVPKWARIHLLSGALEEAKACAVMDQAMKAIRETMVKAGYTPPA